MSGPRSSRRHDPRDAALARPLWGGQSRQWPRSPQTGVCVPSSALLLGHLGKCSHLELHPLIPTRRVVMSPRADSYSQGPVSPLRPQPLFFSVLVDSCSFHHVFIQS